MTKYKMETFKAYVTDCNGEQKEIAVDGYAFDDRYAAIPEGNGKYFIMSTIIGKPFGRYETSIRKAFERIAREYDTLEEITERYLVEHCGYVTYTVHTKKLGA